MLDALYETDFFAWTEAQAAALRRAGAMRVNAGLDWSHLADEIEAMGRSERAAVESLLERIILHLLKLEHSIAVTPRAHWSKEIATFRLDIAKRLRRAPSLPGRIDLAEVYADARRRAAITLRDDGVDPAEVPQECPYALDQLLDAGWWPGGRGGDE